MYELSLLQYQQNSDEITGEISCKLVLLDFLELPVSSQLLFKLRKTFIQSEDMPSLPTGPLLQRQLSEGRLEATQIQLLFLSVV